MLIIQLYAAPGSGKSTGAAYIFSKLKMAGVNAELVTEFAKDKVWERNGKALQNQAYVFGKQYYRISRLEGEVDVVVTDSPLLLGIMYNADPRLGEPFNQMMISCAKSYESLNFLVRRVKPYNPKGRLQTESESDAIQVKIKDLLKEHFPFYEEINGDIEGYEKVVSRTLEYLKDKGQKTNG